MSANPIESIAMLQGGPLSETAALSPLAQQSNFADWLITGATRVDQTARLADDAVTRFALDGSVPPHQVMIALEDARMSLQLALQVRSRIVEGYQELMRMQL
ncbi:Flagellar hook-basal body complex protein FliE [Burkholderia contaminans]|uniref:flagellar hook-basal body complex protein FliE n=1 Tax=Burkholderia contaminans TaxID=488447 RepID=UPI001452FF97|nr:flagellar hook-basal body complex protein FliE [Burkholderia contaminans]VWD47005.1 Flagellar hook-basal body complex protein FliE [Burkholderia contaminans]